MKIALREMIFGWIHPRTSPPRLSYNDVAAVYDSARPNYPEELVDDVLNFAGAPGAARVLEIGSGTGQATTSFAARDLRFVCLEPGPAMVHIARERLGSFDQVEVMCQTFESWTLESCAFDLIFSATAFHWVSRRVRFEKTALALRHGGTLAVFNAVPFPETASLPDAVKSVLKRKRELSDDPQPWPFERQFRESRAFGTADKRVYFTKRTYDVGGFEALLHSLNRFRCLPMHEQSAVLKAARAGVESQGGLMPLEFRVRLIMARRESTRPKWRGVAHRWFRRST